MLVAHALVLARHAGGGTDVDDANLLVALAGVVLQGRLRLFADLDAAHLVAHALVLARGAGGGTEVNDANLFVALAGVALQGRLRLVRRPGCRSCSLPTHWFWRAVPAAEPT